MHQHAGLLNALLSEEQLHSITSQHLLKKQNEGAEMMNINHEIEAQPR